MNSSQLSEPHFTAIISLRNTFSLFRAAVFDLITHSKCPIRDGDLHRCIKAAQAGSAFGLSTIKDCSKIKVALNQSKTGVPCCLVLQPVQSQESQSWASIESRAHVCAAFE